MLDRFADYFAALTIKHFGGIRIAFYEGFRNLVENGISPNDALKELNQIWSYGGKKPTEPLAVFTRDLMIQLMDGESLSRALSRWVPYEEASLLAAGERGSNGLSQACDDVVRIIEAKQQIRGAVASAIAYPSFLMVSLGVMLWVVSTKLVPKMAQASNPDAWTGNAYALYLLSNGVTNFGVLAICVVLMLAIGFAYSLPRWTGASRSAIDRGPFYSTYRMVHGSTFLLNLAVMMRANMPPDLALTVLGEYANPWLKERIAAARHGLKLGSNVGLALENAGHGFPDIKAIQFVRILAAREGFPEALNRYATRWLATSIKKLQLFSRLMFTVSLLLIGAVMALTLAGTQDMQSNFEHSISRTSSKIAAP